MKLVLRGYNPIMAELALLTVNYKSVEAAHIYISGTEPNSNKQFHEFLPTILGPPLCAICRLVREQHLEAEIDDPEIQAPSLSDIDDAEASPQRRYISLGRTNKLFRKNIIKLPQCSICLDDLIEDSTYNLNCGHAYCTGCI